MTLLGLGGVSVGKTWHIKVLARQIVIAGALIFLPGCATLYELDRGSAPRYLPPPPKPRGEVQVATPLGEDIANYKVSRKIAMVYKVDLKRHNYYSPAVAQRLQAYDEVVRQCYVNRLDAVPNLKGHITFNVTLSKSTGTIDKIERTSGSLKDQAVVQCIKQRIARINFNPPTNMLGKIQFAFAYVDKQEPVASSK